MVWLSVIPFNASASIIDCKLRYLPIFLTSSQFIILMIPFFTAPNLRFLFNCPLFCLFNDLALSMSSVLFGRCLVHHSLRRQYIIAAVCYPLSGYFLTWINRQRITFKPFSFRHYFYSNIICMIGKIIKNVIISIVFFAKKMEGVYTLPVLAIIWLLTTTKYGII